jgi:hypothetical protein
MKKLILIFSLILTCQFLTNAQEYTWSGFSEWDNQGDTIVHVAPDTTAITLLVTACQDCPAHAMKGYIYQSYNNSGYLDEYKKELPKSYIVWDYRNRKLTPKK